MISILLQRLTLVHLAAKVSVPAARAIRTGAYATNVAGAVAVCTEVIDWAADLAIPVRLST